MYWSTLLLELVAGGLTGAANKSTYPISLQKKTNVRPKFIQAQQQRKSVPITK